MLGKALITTAIATSMVFITSTASALELTPYIFGTVGIADPDLGKLEDKYNAMVDQAGDNGGSATLDQDDRDSAWAAGIGIQLSRYFALEASYYRLGSYDIEASGSFARGRGDVSLAGGAEAKVRGWGAQAILIAPFTDNFSGTLSAGPAYLKTEVKGKYSYTYDSALFSDSKQERYNKSYSDTVANLGVGTRYAFSDSFSIRVDYNHLGGIGDYFEAEECIDFLSAGLVYSF